MAEPVPLVPALDLTTDPEEVTKDEFIRAMQESFPHECEIVRLRVITAKYRALRNTGGQEDDDE